MKMYRFAGVACAALAVSLIWACSNPADNKPEARINSPATASAGPASAPSDSDALFAASGESSEAAADEIALAAEDALDQIEAAGGEAAAEADAPSTRVYAITPENSAIGFIGSKVTGSHDGGFNDFEGKIVLDGESHENASVEVTIDAASLWSDTDRLTGHLKSPDFFDVESYPTASFVSTKIEPMPGAENQYEVTGDLTLRGVTRNITFPATIEATDDAVRAQSEFFIKRFDFNIEYKGKADDLIRDEVVIKLDIEAPRAADEG